MILDIGVEFVRCSKYLFINHIFSLLKSKYNVEKTEGEILGSFNSINSTANNSPSNRTTKTLKI